ncbi:hypothetical protein [Nocardia sp. XZ_19_369]|uniref:hypothetical protein n=1 Tax=Nocardia sp. XZ_19_369 TaxID=2769487 RepID=UPI001890659C|nr:hypothetical protein [Nocardia sp. XZ_19_369]
MQEAQTPRQALDIAAATTRQAHEAAALPTWGPVAAGVFAGLFTGLLTTVNRLGIDDPRAWIAAIAGIASGLAYYTIARWLHRTRRARGLIPLPLAQWKQITVLALIVPTVPLLGLADQRMSGWLPLLCGLITGGWIWFELARPQTAPWKTRPWRT